MREINYTSCHNHSMYSNFRLLDCINKPKQLIDLAIELGYNGLALTDHECLSGLPETIKYVRNLKEKHKDNENIQNFKFILGNEAYVVNDLEKTKENYKTYKNGFYHLVLLAKDYEGYELLKKLSTQAWLDSYTGRGMERCPLEKAKMKRIVESNKGHLIASSACLGSEIAKILLQKASTLHDINKYKRILSKDSDKLTQQTIDTYKKEYEALVEKYNTIMTDIEEYFEFYIDLFGEDFYLELQPSNSPEQVIVNKELVELGKKLNIKWIVTTDSHYLTIEDRPIHKAYLNSKDGDREVDDFYATTYMMPVEEIYNYLINNEISIEDSELALSNTKEIYDKCTEYKLEKGYQVPKIDVSDKLETLKEDEKIKDLINQFDKNEHKSVFAFLSSDNEQEEYYIYSCLDGILNKKIVLDDIKKDRINQECEELIEISKALGECLAQYYVSVQKIIELMWNEGDSLVGCGRGSVGCWYTAYLMGITEVDALQWDLPLWRHIHRSKIELSDIDIDSQASRRQSILTAIKKYFGYDRVLNICTFGTEGSKASLSTACRGLGIDSDISIYLASLIPVTRGFNATLEECFNGNEEKGLKPITELINQVAKYPMLKETAFRIEGLVNKRSIHASAIVIYNEPYVNHTPMMKAPNGIPITAYEMHTIEDMGGVKIDMLTVEALDKIRMCMDLLIEDELMERKETLRDTYNYYIHPSKLDYESEDMWKMIDSGAVVSLFQYNTELGISISKKLQPRSVMDMSNGNSIMRLIAEDGKEMPVDKFLKFRNNPDEWETEMDSYNLTNSERIILHKYLDYCYGVPSQQEDLQRPVMDKETWNYSVGQSTKCRKVISKKQLKEIPTLHQQLYDDGIKNGLSENFIKYVWDMIYVPQLGYGFSLPHCVAYSIIAIQELNLAYKYPIVYWNCASLCVDAGMQDDTETEDDDENKVILDEDDENEDNTSQVIETKKKKTKTTDYSKIATALNDMMSKGIKIVPPDINKSKYDFRPDAKNNQIIYGLKAIHGISEDVINSLIKYQPFESIQDVLNKVKLNRTQIIALIKAGTFDNITTVSKREMLYNYISSISDLKDNLTLSNVPMLVKNNLLTEEDLILPLEKYNFNKQLRAKQAKKDKKVLIMDKDDINYYTQYWDEDLLITEDNTTYILEKSWKKIYDKEMDTIRDFITENKENLLRQINNNAIKENLLKYAQGSESAWEMDVLCFYYSGHELTRVDENLYNIIDFHELEEQPEVSLFTQWKGQAYPIYKLNTIMGTVIGKNKLRHTVALLTTKGQVVYVKFYGEMFSFFDKQISEKQEDGKKKVMEKSWFTRGNKLLITGIRKEEQFFPKSYKSTPIKQLYLINKVNNDGSLVLQDHRFGYEKE